MAVKQIQLRPQSFPPGSSREFVDAIIRLTDQSGSSSSTADQALSTANNALAIAQAQAVRNDAQDIVLSDHAFQLAGLRTDVNSNTTRIGSLEAWRTYTTRQKSEVVYSGLSLVIPTTPTNFFTLLNSVTPTSGNPLPFFQLAEGRLVALNKNLDLKLKFTLEGVFGGAVLSRSLAFVFGTAVPDTIYINRNTALAADSMNLNTFFSVEEGDDITSPGITCTVQSVGGTFTASRIKIIATQ